jgi:ABC-2 type transport system ATP-binding protein
MSDLAIDISSLHKRYGRGTGALNDVRLAVPRGCVFGLIGPNGAGKSTLIKALLTIIRPTFCQGTLLSEPIGHKATLAHVGYLPEHAQFPAYLTGRQVIEYAAGLAHLSRSQCRKRCDELLDLVDMNAHASRRISTYSKGMKQRIGLAQALIHDPQMVFLDEPTDGVDPEGRMVIKDLIAAMRTDGRTVFVNSHLLSEIEQVADHVAMLSQGSIVAQGPIAELTRKDARYEICFDGQLPVALMNWCLQQGMEIQGHCITCHAESAAMVQPLIDKLRASLVVIREIKEQRFSLEQLFLQVLTDSRKTAPAAP